MLTLYALRHGTTEWNERGLMQGRRDIALSATGRAEVARWRLPTDVPHDALLVSSPLARAVETAMIVGGRMPVVEPALIEMDWGRWEGRTIDELRAADSVGYEANARRGLDFRPPGGECPRDVVARVRGWLARIAGRPATVVAVSHNGVLRALVSCATGWDMTGKPPIRLRAACVHRFGIGPDGTVSLAEANIPLAGKAL